VPTRRPLLVLSIEIRSAWALRAHPTESHKTFLPFFMSRYRRASKQGTTYFFTVVTYRRQPVLCNDAVRTALRNAIEAVRITRPFTIDAWVLMPDHLHCIWTLPEGDSDFSTRWMMIKRMVSIATRDTTFRADWVNSSKHKHRESTLWQRRFWEHAIRDDEDFGRHVDYIHWNPVKHGLVANAADWPYSTFHRFLNDGIYTRDWGTAESSIVNIPAGE